MATIGTFTKSKTGFTGTIATLALKADVAITATKATGDKEPDYRVTIGDVELGAGWTHEAKNGNEYVRVKLDDPMFAAPVFANLVKRDDGYELLWSRNERKSRD